jgi:uroporphyrinogen decarboxylase
MVELSSNSKSLIQKMFQRTSVARVGLTDSLWSDTLLLWVQEGYPTRWVHKKVGQQYWRKDDGQWEDVKEEGAYEEPVPPWQHFQYDMVGIGPWMDYLPLRDYEETVQETETWKIIRNGAGASFKFWKHKMGTPEHINFRMSSREIWESDYRPHLLNLDPLRIDIEELLTNREEAEASHVWTHYGNIFIWEIMRQSMGDITLYESLLLDPGWIHDFGQVYTRFYKKHFDYMFEKTGLPDGIWLYEDLGYKNGLFASPQVLESLIFPYYHELITYFHEKGLPVILHSCGSQAAALDLIVEAGFDGLNPMERKAKDNDPYRFAEIYHDKLVFIGGMDVRIFESNDKDLIKKEVGIYIDGMKAKGARFLFASDHSITPNVHYDTYRYILDVYREHMDY